MGTEEQLPDHLLGAETSECNAVNFYSLLLFRGSMISAVGLTYEKCTPQF